MENGRTWTYGWECPHTSFKCPSGIGPSREWEKKGAQPWTGGLHLHFCPGLHEYYGQVWHICLSYCMVHYKIRYQTACLIRKEKSRLRNGHSLTEEVYNCKRILSTQCIKGCKCPPSPHPLHQLKWPHTLNPLHHWNKRQFRSCCVAKGFHEKILHSH